MSKDLPSIFKNTPNRKINNNKNVYYSKYGNLIEPVKNDESIIEDNSLNGTVNNMLKNRQFVFNVPVEIKTKDGIFNSSIVSKVGDHLLTSDGKTIIIEDILSIKLRSI